MQGLSQVRLFEVQDENFKPIHSIPFTVFENRLVLDLTSLPADRITEMEKSVAALREEENPCHWILDYPYFHHQHSNSISIEDDRLILETNEQEHLPLLAQSSCVVPQKVSYLMPFSKTQFGFEANQQCISGRPFLDSISPVVLDPLNPYLSFKLQEVDAFSIPEDKFREISTDAQIRVMPGLQYFLYLKSENLTAQQMLTLTSILDLREITRAVLNDHAELFLADKENGSREVWKTPFYFGIPEQAPFRLIGDRLKIQLQNHGFQISPKPLPKNAPSLELAVQEVRESDLDVFRYRLLKETLQIYSETSWDEEWDDLEASGKIVPLLLYESRIAVRNNVMDVRSGAGGMPDFSNAWILPVP